MKRHFKWLNQEDFYILWGLPQLRYHHSIIGLQPTNILFLIPVRCVYWNASIGNIMQMHSRWRDATMCAECIEFWKRTKYLNKTNEYRKVHRNDSLHNEMWMDKSEGQFSHLWMFSGWSDVVCWELSYNLDWPSSDDIRLKSPHWSGTTARVHNDGGSWWRNAEMI